MTKKSEPRARRVLVVTAIPGARGDLLICFLRETWPEIFLPATAPCEQCTKTGRTCLSSYPLAPGTGSPNPMSIDDIQHESSLYLDRSQWQHETAPWAYMITKTHISSHWYWHNLDPDQLEHRDYLDILVDQTDCATVTWEAWVKMHLALEISETFSGYGRLHWQNADLETLYHGWGTTQRHLLNSADWQQHLQSDWNRSYSGSTGRSRVMSVDYHTVFTQADITPVCTALNLDCTPDIQQHWQRKNQLATSQLSYQHAGRTWTRWDLVQ